MTEQLDALRDQLDSELLALRKSAGKTMIMSESAPIGTKTARALLDVVEAQAREVEQLKSRVHELERRSDA